MNVKNMMYMAMFAAVVGVLGLLPPIPNPIAPVPITAQTLGVMLAGSLLGARRGAGSMMLVVSIIAVGVPLLAGGRGGIGTLLGPSGGYVMAWPVAAWFIGFIMERVQVTIKWALLANITGGILIIYAFGITYYAFIADLSLGVAAISALPYIPGDTLKAIAASYLTMKMFQRYPSLMNANRGEQREKAKEEAAG